MEIVNMVVRFISMLAIPFVIFAVICFLVVIWKRGKNKAGRYLIMPFCHDIQRYRFDGLWKIKVRETYNSISIGMTFEEINERFNAAQESILLQGTVEPQEIPPYLKSPFSDLCSK